MTRRELPQPVKGLFLLVFLGQEVAPLNDSTTVPQPPTLWNLHGAQGFYPCRFVKSAPEVEKSDTVECNEEASAILGNSVPTIHPDGLVVHEIRILADRTLQVIPERAFERIGPEIKKVSIRGGDIRVVKREAFAGLTELRTLEIRNERGAETWWPQGGLSGRLFTGDGELKNLKKLKRLVLENVDLSDGLAAYAFYDMSRSLEEVELRGNNLETINPYTFEKSECRRSLRKLSLERQNASLKWLDNAYRWARDLGGIQVLSLSGNDLSGRKLDFGNNLNKKLRVLKIENCTLKDIPEALLDNIQSLEEVYAGENEFKIISKDEAGVMLAGLKKFTRLSKLSLQGNKGLIYRQPTWLRTAKVKDLDYSGSLLRRIGPRELPTELETLRLRSTFLEDVDSDWTVNMPRLSALYLTSSYIKTVKINGLGGNWEAAFEPLKSQLKVLSLSECHIISQSLETDEDAAFQVAGLRLGLNQLQRLECLDLSGNYLTHIPRDAFVNLTMLSKLNLSNNHLQTLLTIESNATAFLGTSMLRELDLTNNVLTSILKSRSAMGYNSSLQELLADGAEVKLSGNPIICDCRIGWMVGTALKIDNFTCSGKNALTGRGYHQIVKQDFSNGSKCFDKDHTSAPQQHHPFRPVRVFSYDASQCRVYFAVKGSALRAAWENIARMAPSYQRLELKKYLAALNNMTSEVISRLQKEYLVFEVAYWPVGQISEMQGTLGWQVVNEKLMHSDVEEREYVFSVQPIDIKRAHTVCFRNALDRRNAVSSTLCQIFQPSELSLKAGTEDRVAGISHTHVPLWLVVMATASVVILITCLIWLCIRYKCCRRRSNVDSQRDSPKGTTTNPTSGYLDYRPLSENLYDKLENCHIQTSLPDLQTTIVENDRPELPRRTNRRGSKTLPTLAGSLGELTTRRYAAQSRVRSRQTPVSRRQNHCNSTPRLPLPSPKMPLPLMYQRPKTVTAAIPTLDESGYVKMRVDEDYLEARPEKCMRRKEPVDDMLVNSYILGMPQAALERQISEPVSKPSTELGSKHPLPSCTLP